METFVGIVFIIVCLLLIVVVLLQKGRGGGLGAAFGGGGSSAFGTRTGDVFTWVTIVLTSLFLLLAIAATVVYRPDSSEPVLTPKLAPDKGPISVTTVVRITCGTDNARIAYTTDDSKPVQEKAKQVAPVSVVVEPGQTLRVRAFRKNRPASDPVTVTYEKKKAPASQPTKAKAGASTTPTSNENTDGKSKDK